jgi:3-dehydroquinate dehydratase/shikimate dehydrogenase
VTRIILSIPVERASDVARAAETARSRGVRSVELRLDGYLEDPEAVALAMEPHADICWILTERSEAEGGVSVGDIDQRIQRLLAARGATHAMVDIEWDDLLQRDEIADWARQSIGDTSIILSHHEGPGPSASAEDALRQVRSRFPESVAKWAYSVADIMQSFRAFDLMRDHGEHVIAIAMGEAGAWTRVLAPKFGAYGTFASSSHERATAPGQFTVDQLVEAYGFEQIGPTTSVYGVIGDPVAHSMSPALLNAWFQHYQIDSVYLPLRVREGRLPEFLQACHDRPWMSVGGFSVTLPHKVAALQWAGDGADRLAKSIGAANTLSFGAGSVSAFNTDIYAAVDAICSALDCERHELVNTTVDVLGCGGAARGLLAGLNEFGCRTKIYGRSAERTAEVAADYHAEPCRWEDRSGRRGDVLINTTPIGMWPDKASPMESEWLSGCRLVFDMVYNPLETTLLAEAHRQGLNVLGGLEMFVRQAAAQFELWTGVEPDLSYGRGIVAGCLAVRDE